MSKKILEVCGLTKWFRDPWTFRPNTVLEELDFQIEEGEVFGLIGPNGAGKTTAFKLLLGLIRPSKGEVLFSGRAVDRSARGQIGFLPEQPYFYDYLTVEETLDFYARLYGISKSVRRRRLDEVIDLVQVGSKRRARLHTLSKGMMQRVGIAQAILNKPRLAILDEPMSGLDPLGRHHMREVIAALQEQGTTVLFSSHILPDAEAICSRVGILVQGRLREVVDLRAETTTAYVLTFREVDEETLKMIERAAGAAASPRRNGWMLRVPSSAATQAAEVIWNRHGVLERLEPLTLSLEERFLEHVGDAGRLE